MAVPNVPFYMSQANQEFLGTPVGYISATMGAAGVSIPGLVSQLAGKSAITGAPYILTVSKSTDLYLEEYAGYTTLPEGEGLNPFGALTPNTIDGILVGTLYEYNNAGSYTVSYYNGLAELPSVRIYDVRTGAIYFGSKFYGVGAWVLNGVPTPAFSAWHDAFNLYGEGYQNELLIEIGDIFIVKPPSNIIQAQGGPASYYLISGYPNAEPYYNTQIENGVYTILASVAESSSFEYRITVLNSVNAYVDYQYIADGDPFEVRPDIPRGINITSLDGITVGTATFTLELLDSVSQEVKHSYTITLESAP